MVVCKVSVVTPRCKQAVSRGWRSARGCAGPEGSIDEVERVGREIHPFSMPLMAIGWQELGRLLPSEMVSLE